VSRLGCANHIGCQTSGYLRLSLLVYREAAGAVSVSYQSKFLQMPPSAEQRAHRATALRDLGRRRNLI